jgi:hypothetical protein
MENFKEDKPNVSNEKRQEAEERIAILTENPEILLQRKIWEEKIRDLLEYIKQHPEQAQLIKKIENLISMDHRFGEERAFYGGSSEIRKWERETSKEETKEIKEEIKRLNISDEQIDIILSKIFLASHEYFESNVRSYPQDKLDKSYEEILNGNYSYFEGYRKLLKEKE